MTLHRLIERYIRYRQALGERFQSNAAILRAFAKAVGPDAAVGDVRPARVRTFLAGVGPLTAYWHNKYRALSGFYAYAMSRGHATASPLPTAQPKRVPSAAPYIYSREELRRLLDATGCYQLLDGVLAPDTVRVILLALYGTGLRTGEILRLNRQDVDLADRVLTIRLTKFHKSRLVPFGPPIAQALSDYARDRHAPAGRPGPESPFFVTRTGTRIVLNTLQAHFRQVRAKAGIRRPGGARSQPRMHDLRHTFAVHRLTTWYEQGADVQTLIHQLSVYLGHAHLADTQVYLSMTPDLLRAANERFDRYAHSGGPS